MFVSLPIHDCPSLCPSGITGMSSVASPSKDFTIPEGVHVMLIEYARSDAAGSRKHFGAGAGELLRAAMMVQMRTPRPCMRLFSHCFGCV